MTEVVWFRNDHEDRNYLLRFGLMKLHLRGEVIYFEQQLTDIPKFGLHGYLQHHRHMHTSVLLIKSADRKIVCLVDSQDSFFFITDLIKYVDVYFCSGYNTDFFDRRIFNPPYAWQTNTQVVWYHKKAAELIAKYGDFFWKVRKFIPIGPSLDHSDGRHVGFISRKLEGLRWRSYQAFYKSLDWSEAYHTFERRYEYLLKLRSSPLRYDIVLSDTLWGWPRHRLALHQKLLELSTDHKIHSQLKWADSVEEDGSMLAPLNRNMFPIQRNTIDHYEQMLAQSRIAVHATGFHYGWRAITMLALLFGLPIYMDKPILEPWFAFDNFQLTFNETGDWSSLPSLLQNTTLEVWNQTKAFNQQYYDRVMAPERVARYFLQTARKSAEMA
jgi:hypothetical protein